MAVSAVVASGGDGGVRAERTEEGESVRGRERGSRGLRGDSRVVQAAEGARRQGGGGTGACRRTVATRPASFCHEEDDRGG